MQSAWLNSVNSHFQIFFHGFSFKSIHNNLFPSKISRHATYTVLEWIFKYSVMFLSFCLHISFSFWNMLMSVQTEVCIAFLVVFFEGFFCFISLLELRFAYHLYNFSFILGKRSLPLITQLLIHRVYFAWSYSLMTKVMKLAEAVYVDISPSLMYFSEWCFHFQKCLVSV